MNSELEAMKISYPTFLDLASGNDWTAEETLRRGPVGRFLKQKSAGLRCATFIGT